MTTRISLSLMLAMVVALVLAACDTAPPPPDQLRNLAIPTSTAYGVPSYNFILTYTENGGLAPQEKKLVVDVIGNASYTDANYAVTATLDDTRMAALRAAFEQNNFTKLNTRYEPKQPVADGIVKTVTYTTYKGESKKVTVATGSTPPAAWSQIDAGIADVITYLKSTIDQGVIDVMQIYPVAVWSLPLHLESYAPQNGTARAIKPAEISQEVYAFIRSHYSDADLGKNLMIYQPRDGGYYRLQPEYALNLSYEQVKNGQAGIKVERQKVGTMPQDLNLDLSRVPATGMALQAEKYRAVRDMLEGQNSAQTNLFVDGTPGAQSFVYQIRLRHGGARLQ